MKLQLPESTSDVTSFVKDIPRANTRRSLSMPHSPVIHLQTRSTELYYPRSQIARATWPSYMPKSNEVGSHRSIKALTW